MTMYMAVSSNKSDVHLPSARLSVLCEAYTQSHSQVSSSDMASVRMVFAVELVSQQPGKCMLGPH